VPYQYNLLPKRLDVDPLVGSPFPIDLDLIKSHLAIDYSDQDELIEKFALAAIEAFEGTTHRTLIQREHTWVLASFPFSYKLGIWLPRGRTVSVEQIAYVSGGQTVTLTGPTSTPTGDDYQEDLRGNDGGCLLPLQGESWPSVDIDAVAPVAISFTAGWETAEMPADALNALLFFIRTSLDDARTDPMKSEANMRVFEAMVSGFRLTRFY
jgi:uncharacterized phiE125 gp8 family phage protein